MSKFLQVLFPNLEPGERRWLGYGLGLLVATALMVSAFLHGVIITAFDSPGHDGYIQLARSVVHGHGYRFAESSPLVLYRPPGYVALLLPIALFPAGWQPALVIVLNAVLLWGAGCFMYLSAREVFSAKVAKIAVLLLWLNPSVLWCLKNPMSWILEMLAMAALVYWARRTWQSNNWRAAAVLGAVAGGALLSHGVFLLVVAIPALLAAGWMGWTRKWSKAAPLAVALAVTALVVLPWTLRNYFASGRFIPVVVGAGHAYFTGNAIAGQTPLDPAIRPTPHAFVYSDDLAALQMAGLDAGLMKGADFGGFPNNNADDQFDEAMARDLRREPLQLIPKSLYNALQMYFPSTHFVWRSPVYQTATPISAAVLYDGLISLWNLLLWILAVQGWRGSPASAQRQGVLIFLGGLAAYTLPYLPLCSTVNHAGYTFPAYVLLFPLAALGLERIMARP
jgi:4-amino-4-deoxy-L-arabinose transferase-like glycosyltransferase